MRIGLLGRSSGGACGAARHAISEHASSAARNDRRVRLIGIRPRPRVRGFEDASVRDDPAELADVGDLRERIGVQHDHVGALARFDRAGVLAESHRLRGHARRRFDRLHRRHAGLDVHLDRSQQAVAGQRAVGAGDDRHAGIEERLDHRLRNRGRAASRLPRRCRSSRCDSWRAAPAAHARSRARSFRAASPARGRAARSTAASDRSRSSASPAARWSRAFAAIADRR